MTDHELLQRYVEEGSCRAFGDLVQRHLGLVLGAARRQLTVPHLAEDVAQRVFALLAAKASRLNKNVILSGWLYRVTCRLVAETNRSEYRRQRREIESMAMNPETSPDETWCQISHLLDEAMGTLPQQDRDAVVMRYFESRSLREVGTALGASDDAAQKRIGRAMDRLRQFFARHGHSVSGGAIASAIGVGALETTTPAAAASIAGIALAGGTATTAGALTFFTMTNIKTILVGGVGICAAAALTVQQVNINRLKNEVRELRSEQAEVAAAPVAPASTNTETHVDPEMLRLRGEVAALQKLKPMLVHMRDEITRLDTELTAAKHAAAVATPEAEPQPIDPAREIMKKRGIAKMIYVKQLVVGILLYADKNHGQIPKSLTEALSELANAPQAGEPNESPNPTDLTLEHYELVQQGSLLENQNPAQTIAIRERSEFAMQHPDGSIHRCYGFLDGHSEIHRFETSDFASWEQERMGTRRTGTGGLGQ